MTLKIGSPFVAFFPYYYDGRMSRDYMAIETRESHLDILARETLQPRSSVVCRCISGHSGLVESLNY